MREGDRGPVRVFRLGAEPLADLSATTTVSERLKILGELAARSWRLTGRAFPKYQRHEIPVRVIRLE